MNLVLTTTLFIRSNELVKNFPRVLCDLFRASQHHDSAVRENNSLLGI